ncbi:alpha-N-arabinofuranosidase [Rubellimicrobium rubrum]|uniref:arabinosylfuranosidase ArfA n=1 Tax=Rubellimicrobium rubrum TaxID=2585369 RepID=UPI00248250D0|nr:alpha-N-arabinofuranosidase [Rubellimicrobium rubrum]
MNVMVEGQGSGAAQAGEVLAARVTAHRDYTIAKIDDRIYSGFLEHLGRAIYSGIYEPGHPTADAQGFRGDVAEVVKALQMPFVRYPGGNFVSSYNWEDGIGPREDRPTRLDLAWHTSESNEIGIHEFMDWCEIVDTKPMLALNLGSRGLDEARNFVEYVNGPTGAYWGDLRKKNGRAEPWNCRLWCLGNEMDGPWQIGQKTAHEYGRLSGEVAKALRAFDKSLELVVCGSSNPKMPTYPEWERIVLEHTYESVDYLSLHMYSQNKAKNTAEYLALSETLDRYIGTIQSVINVVKANKRSKHDVAICFDEWNVWYHSHEQDKAILQGMEGWPKAPRLLEDIYNFEDVLQVGLTLNTFIRRADVVKIACIAQIVNVIAPIMTEPGGPVWRQTTYWPFLLTSLYGRGTALRLAVASPTYDTETAGEVPYLDIAGVQDDAGRTITFFAVNRHPDRAITTAVSLEGFAAAKVVDHQVMTHPDLRAVNTMEQPDLIAPKPGTGAAVEGGILHLTLPPYSWQMIRVGV